MMRFRLGKSSDVVCDRTSVVASVKPQFPFPRVPLRRRPPRPLSGDNQERRAPAPWLAPPNPEECSPPRRPGQIVGGPPLSPGPKGPELHPPPPRRRAPPLTHTPLPVVQGSSPESSFPRVRPRLWLFAPAPGVEESAELLHGEGQIDKQLA